MVMDLEERVGRPERRVGELEGTFGFLVEQIEGVHRDVIGFKEETRRNFARVNGRLDNMDGRLDKVETEVRKLRQDLPGIVGDAMRDVLDK